jgi:fimbrial chaperone protein
MLYRALCLSVLIAAAGSGSAQATSLQAAPVLIEMPNGSPTSSVSVRNIGRTAFDVQTRIFRWKQQDGKDVLEETDDVVTSPPITTLKPGANYAVRIVKVNGAPVEKEEAFRLLVDQLPDEDKMRGGTVALVMRHSIPVFLLPEQSGGPKLRWSISNRGGRLVLHVQNDGGRRVRLSNVSVSLPGGKTISFGSGLLGYVLAGSSMQWQSAVGTSVVTAGQTPKIVATSDQGPVNAAARVAP